MTNEEILKKIDSIIPTFDNLEARWQDEKADEDFSEYKAAMKAAVDGVEGLSYIDFHSHPFRVFIKAEGSDDQYIIHLKGGKIAVSSY